MVTQAAVVPLVTKRHYTVRADLVTYGFIASCPVCDETILGGKRKRKEYHNQIMNGRQGSKQPSTDLTRESRQNWSEQIVRMSSRGGAKVMEKLLMRTLR